MVAIGEALWAIGRWLILFLMQYGGTILAQTIGFLGFRWLTHRVSDSFMHSTFANLFAQLPATLAHTMALLRADVAVSIILSAVVYRMGRAAVAHFVQTAAASGGGS